LEDKITSGSIETTDLQKRQYARESMEANKRDPMFCKIFPDLIKGTVITAPLLLRLLLLHCVPVLTTAAVAVNRVRGQTASGGVRAREHRYVNVDINSDGRGRPAGW
jgi:hypothetical protein